MSPVLWPRRGRLVGRSQRHDVLNVQTLQRNWQGAEMIERPGRKPERSMALLLDRFVRRSTDETIIIHHVTEDTPKRLQLEVERRTPRGISFERIVL